MHEFIDRKSHESTLSLLPGLRKAEAMYLARGMNFSSVFPLIGGDQHRDKDWLDNRGTRLKRNLIGHLEKCSLMILCHQEGNKTLCKFYAALVGDSTEW